MIFPNELKLEILQYLNKAQLKLVRLVSKLWSGCASEYLWVLSESPFPPLNQIMSLETLLESVQSLDIPHGSL